MGAFLASELLFLKHICQFLRFSSLSRCLAHAMDNDILDLPPEADQANLVETFLKDFRVTSTEEDIFG